MDNRITPTTTSENYINLLDLVYTALQGKWLILTFATIVAVLAFIYAYGQPINFKADTLLRVESQNASIPGIEQLAGLSTVETSVGTELELIKSRRNLAVAVEILKLDIVAKPRKIYLLGNIHERFISPLDTKKLPAIWGKFDAWASKYAWGNEKIKVNQLELPQKWLNTPLKVVVKEEKFFDIILNNNKILEGVVGETSTSGDGLFSIFVLELTGLPGTEFSLTKLSMRKAIASLKQKIQATEKGKSTGIISISLIGNNVKTIRETLNKISETYVEQNKSRSAEEASNALIFLEEQIKPIKEGLDKAEANLENYRTENKTTDLPQETQAILDIITEIDSELQKYSLLREELKQRYTDQHPKIQALNAQEDKLNLRKDQTLAKIEKIPKAQQRLFELEREIRVSNSIYVDLLNKIQEFKIAKASTVGNAYVVDTADIDETFKSPNHKKIVFNGALLGSILGFIFIFLSKALRSTIDNPDELEEQLGIPVYATILLSKSIKKFGGYKRKNKESLLFKDNNTDKAIEGLRSLRTSLHFALHQAKNNIVMITGASPNVGKTFISSNFAAVLADTGQRVVLIDADMRKGYLHELFDLEIFPGLSDIISLNANIDDVINTIQVGDSSLDVITLGRTPPNPSELLMNDNFKKLLKYLSSQYDVVLIDSPPILNVTDPAIIGSHAGVVFMVVNPQYNSVKEIDHAVKQLSNTGIDTKGFIFNGYTPKSKHFEYGYGSYYGQYK